MKKFYLVTSILLLLAVMSSMAQSTDSTFTFNHPQDSTFKTVWYVGGGGNLNSTWIMNENMYGEPGLKGNLTINYGFNVNVGFDYNYHFGFKTELGYAMLGQKSEGTQYGLEADRSINLSYLLLPVMIKYRTKGNVAKFYAMSGIEAALLLTATQKYQRNGTDAPVYNHPQQGLIDVSATNIKNRYTGAACCLRLDFGLELTPSKHFMIDIGVSTLYSITDLNGYAWRFIVPKTVYHISHDVYCGLNIGFNYKF